MATGNLTVTWDNGRGPRRYVPGGMKVGCGTVTLSTASTYCISGISRAFRYKMHNLICQISGPFVVTYVADASNNHAGVIQVRGFSTGGLRGPDSRPMYFTAFGD